MLPVHSRYDQVTSTQRGNSTECTYTTHLPAHTFGSDIGRFTVERHALQIQLQNVMTPHFASSGQNYAFFAETRHFPPIFYLPLFTDIFMNYQPSHFSIVINSWGMRRDIRIIAKFAPSCCTQQNAKCRIFYPSTRCLHIRAFIAHLFLTAESLGNSHSCQRTLQR